MSPNAFKKADLTGCTAVVTAGGTDMGSFTSTKSNARLGDASVLMLAALAILLPASAQADAAPKPPSPAASTVAGGSTERVGSQVGLEEVIVTAQKRAQKLNDVGISIVAATADQLQNSGVADVSQLAKIAPGFTVGTNYQGFPVFSLRGVNFNAAQFSAPPAVSTYIDEAILPYSPMTAGLLLDVDHVEVLKGPQGTLFGQNATGGSINVIAAKPTSHFVAGVNTEVNQFGQVMLGGYVSGPLSDTLRVRLAAKTTQAGAYQRGYYLNHDKNGNQNKGAIRLLVDWQPTEQLKASLNLNANYDDGEALQFQFGGIAPGHEHNPGLQPGLNGYPLATHSRDVEIPSGFGTKVHNRLYQGVLRLDYELSDAVTLTSLTNFVDFMSMLPQNITGVAIPIQNTLSSGDDQTFSQEIHLAGKAYDDKLNYIVGGNYERDRITDREIIISPAYSLLSPGAVFDTLYHPSNDQKAIFGNLDYEIAPKLAITGGVRYTSVNESTVGCTSGNAQIAGLLGFIGSLFGGNPALYVPGKCLTINDNVPNAATADHGPIGNDVSQKESNVSWRAGLNYKVAPDSLLYALISRGYKAGLFPVEPDLFHSGFVPVKQERLTAYEVGAKLDLLNHALRLNTSVFTYDYSDKQFFTYFLTPVGPTSTVKNIPKSTVRGIEADATVTPIQGLAIRAAATYIKTKIGQFITTGSNGLVQNVTGSEFNYASPFSATVDAEYRFPVGGDRHAYVGGGGLYNGRTYGDLGEAPSQLIPSYLVLDTRIGVESDKGWRVGLFGRNLTDKYYWTGIFFAGDSLARVPGQPRTFGVAASYNY